MPKRDPDPSEEAGSKELEIDDWLFEFAQLFRNNVGIDPEAHIDLHEIGMELRYEALEEMVTSEEAQAAIMRSQIRLFWGNMMFERSQIEFRLGVDVWRKNLDDAVERFKLAGASEADISTVTSNHFSNVDVSGAEGKKK